MKLIVSLTALLLAAAPLVRAQVVVTDPVAHSLSKVQHAQDIAKYVEMVNNQVKQINTLKQQLQQLQAYVKAFGDPEQLLTIVGADQLVSSLQQSGVGDTIGQLRQSADGIEALRYAGDGLYTSLGQTFTTPGGVGVRRAEQLYRKYGAIQQGSRNFQSVTDDVLKRRENLRSDIAATTTKLQASTTHAETQKLTGVLVGYNAELATVDHEIDNATAQIVTQDAENRADRERQEQARREERQAQLEESAKRYGEVFQLETTRPEFPTGR